MKVKYCGPAKDYSGYGEANRHDIASLLSAGVDVTAEIPVYTPDASDYGKLGQMAIDCENKPLGYRIKILHTTPNVYSFYMEPGKYHIGRAFWETDKVPLDFAQQLALVDEIWTGSEYNLQAIRNAGVNKVPIYIIPEAIDESIDINEIQPFLMANDKDFKFYSIFEWTERKNPKGLLTAYWKAFQGVKNVSLTIKTYVDSFSQEKKDEIRRDIRKLKTLLNLPEYPPVYLFTELMTRNQIYRFHKSMDCFVSLHRGEGWGIPQMEAMLLEKPVISTNCGGVHEYLNDGVDSLLISYEKSPVDNTRNKQWYTPDQKWANPNIDEAIKKMKWAYSNKAKLKKMGKSARNVVLNKFSTKQVGRLMLDRLNEINDKILYAQSES